MKKWLWMLDEKPTAIVETSESPEQWRWVVGGIEGAWVNGEFLDGNDSGSLVPYTQLYELIYTKKDLL
jgi:hypothetical protein